MSISTAFQIARSALTTSQIGINVAGQNMANAATPGYSRQSAVLAAISGQRTDPYMIGRGVGVMSVQRKVDEALQSRLFSGISKEFATATKFNVMDQLEGILNELTDADLSSRLGEFFNVWSQATNLADSGAVVVQQGERLASYVRSMRSEMTGLKRQIEGELDAAARRVDSLLEEVALINRTISSTEIGQAQANSLRDRRDQLVQELSTLIDINTVEDPQGNLDILVGSMPVVLAGKNRGVSAVREEVDGQVELRIVVAEDGDPLPVTGGKIGGLIESRDGTIDTVIAQLDELSAQLIFEVNKLHSTGVNKDGFTRLEGALQLPVADRTLALNDPNNQTLSGLPFRAVNGGFYVNVRNDATGSSEQVFIEIDLDGLTSTGGAGFDDDTSAEDIRAALDAIDGVNADWAPDGSLVIASDPGFSYSFQDDTSGALAVLGVNTFFTGTDASTIAVRESLINDPESLALGRIVDGQFVENGTAKEVSGLQSRTLDSLGRRSVTGYWLDAVQGVATAANGARTEAQAALLVRESLEQQRSAVSGVSLDEESINLLNFQRQFQGAARLVTVADEMLQELISLI